MAKKINIPEPPAEFREQYTPGYACFPLKWRERIATLPDAVAGRLFVAVLEHCECGRTTPPEGLDAFSFGFILDAVDEYQERGLQSEWKKKYLAQLAARGRWDSKEEGQGDADGCRRMQTDADKCHNNTITSTSTPTSTITSTPTMKNNPTNTNAQARGVGLEGGEVVLSDYLTPDEEESLFEGAGNYEEGFLERFVLSAYYDRADTLQEKSRKAFQFRNEYNAIIDAEREKADKEREEAERAARLSAYTKGQKPKDFAELEQFCKDMGRPDFDAAALMDEMEYLDWMIEDKKTGVLRPVKNWQNFVIYRLEHSPAAEPEHQTAPRGSGQDW